jgi:hypothetical protein
MESKLINNRLRWYGCILRINKDKNPKKNVNKNIK